MKYSLPSTSNRYWFPIKEKSVPNSIRKERIFLMIACSNSYSECSSPNPIKSSIYSSFTARTAWLRIFSGSAVSKLLCPSKKFSYVFSSILCINTSRSEEHTSELQSRQYTVCRSLFEKKNFLPLSPRFRLPHFPHR